MIDRSVQLSVIVPVYNAELTIERCVYSIISQSVSDLEIILVDDGSPDNSGLICERLAQADNRIRVFHKENGGAASARNVGIDNARGVYIGFVDSDDYIKPDMYESLISILEVNGFPYIDSARINVKNDAVLTHNDTDTLEVMNGEEAIGRLLDWSGNCSLCTHLFRAEVFKDGFRIPEGKRVEDFSFCIHLFDKYGKEAYYDHAFYYVVSHEGSVTKSGGGSIFLDALFYANEIDELVKRKYPSLVGKLEFFRYYCIGQLFINSRPDEISRYSKEYRQYASYLRSHLGRGMKNPFLSPKYKVMLLISCFDYRLPAKLYRKRVKRNGR